jgi:phosphohistidine phosphatase
MTAARRWTPPAGTLRCPSDALPDFPDDNATARAGQACQGLPGRWWLAERQILPDRVVVSPARRALQTWELAAAELGPSRPSTQDEPEIDDRVYRNTVDDLLSVIRETPDAVSTLAIVGHNPAIQELAIALDDTSGDAAGRRELAEKYPTSAVAVFAVADPWAAAETATLISFAIPRG